MPAEVVPAAMLPVLKNPASWVAVCVRVPVFCQFTVVPCATLLTFGLKAKSTTEIVFVAGPGGDGAQGQEQAGQDGQGGSAHRGLLLGRRRWVYARPDGLDGPARPPTLRAERPARNPFLRLSRVWPCPTA